MTFKTINKPFFYISLILVFVLFLVSDIIYQKVNISLRSSIETGIFFTLKNIFFWILFWTVLDKGFKKKYTVFSVVCLSIFFTTIPYFVNFTVFRLDYDNLLFKSACYFIGFLIISIFYFKNFKGRFLLPFFMALMPLINLTIANGFTGNLSFFYFFFHNELNQLVFNNSLVIDWGLALMQTIYFATLVVLFIEVLNFSFNIKSIQAESALKKKHFILIVFSFKTVTYWLVSTLLIGLLSNNSIQLFTNKVGAVLFVLGMFSYLVVSIWFIRRYVTNYFYDKIGTNNWLFVMFFVPLVDILGLLLILLFPFHILRSTFNKFFSINKVIGVLALLFCVYSLLNYILIIKDLPASEADYKMGLIYLNVCFPLVTSILLIVSRIKPMFFSLLIVIFVLMAPLMIIFIIPKIEPSGNLNLLVNSVNIYLHISLLVFFMFPVLYLKSFISVK